MPRYSTQLKHKARKRWNMVPVWLALGGMALVLLALLAVWNNNRQRSASVQVTGAPRLAVEQETIDYGDVKLGTTVRTSVRVTNTGDQSLSFTEAPYIEVKAGC